MAIKIEEFTKLKVSRGSGEKEPLISISKGRAKYLRLNPSLFKQYHLENKKTVDIFLKKESRKSFVIFDFKEDDTGVLSVSRNKKTGTGYISAASLFKELEIDNNKLKKVNFIPKEDTNGENKFYIIEISKE